MGRFSDDIPLKPRGSVQPTTVPMLLRKLHVEDAPFEKQSEAVREWAGAQQTRPDDAAQSCAARIRRLVPQPGRHVLEAIHRRNRGHSHPRTGKGRISAALSVELPGIEAAYIAVELRICFMRQHGATWENMIGNENVLTTVSTLRVLPAGSVGYAARTRGVSSLGIASAPMTTYNTSGQGLGVESLSEDSYRPSQLLVTRPEAARMLSLSESEIDNPRRAGRLQAKRHGKKVLFPVTELERFVEMLPWEADLHR